MRKRYIVAALAAAAAALVSLALLAQPPVEGDYAATRRAGMAMLMQHAPTPDDLDAVYNVGFDTGIYAEICRKWGTSDAECARDFSRDMEPHVAGYFKGDPKRP